MPRFWQALRAWVVGSGEAPPDESRKSLWVMELGRSHNWRGGCISRSRARERADVKDHGSRRRGRLADAVGRQAGRRLGEAGGRCVAGGKDFWPDGRDRPDRRDRGGRGRRGITAIDEAGGRALPSQGRGDEGAGRGNGGFRRVQVGSSSVWGGAAGSRYRDQLSAGAADGGGASPADFEAGRGAGAAAESAGGDRQPESGGKPGEPERGAQRSAAAGIVRRVGTGEPAKRGSAAGRTSARISGPYRSVLGGGSRRA